jgi:8-oxo-dGTP diphosphatase
VYRLLFATSPRVCCSILGCLATSIAVRHAGASSVPRKYPEFKWEFGLKKRATVICRRGKRILLVTRSQSKWALPGGILKRGEHLSDAALRELKEETRLSGKSAKYLFDLRGKQKHHHVFACEISNRAKARPSNEISKCRWVHLDDIPSLMTSGPTTVIVKLMGQRRRK